MGLPEILIEFVGKASSAIKRSQRGIVALILKDDTQTAETVIYKSIEEVDAADWTAENLEYIHMAFKGTPSKVIIEVLPAVAEDYNVALKRLNNKRFNYLAVPQIGGVAGDVIATWLKGKRDNDKKTFKAVLPKMKADHEGIINFTTEGITLEDDSTVTTAEFTARVAGVLAGLPFTRSATYFVFPEVKSITEKEDPNAAIDAGELILFNDGENIKIGRGVNSLTTTTGRKTEDYKSIRIVEVMDLVRDDIKTTFDDEYVGKVNNTYDNQVLFISSVNTYFKALAGDEILDPYAANKADINITAQRLAWESIGVDTSDWDDQRVKENAFKKKIFLRAENFKIVDALEDLDFEIAI